MTSKLLIVSNNPLVWQEAKAPCRQVQGDSLAVLYTCLSLLGEEQHVLFAHPVAGNARLIHNPFRSVLLEEKRNAPQQELQAGIRTLEHFLKKLEALDGSVPESTRDDYQVVDFELFKAMSNSAAPRQ